MSQVNLVDSIRQLGFSGMDEEAGVTLSYIGLMPQIEFEQLKKFVAGRLRLAHIELEGQVGGGKVDISPDMITSLIGLAVLNDNELLSEVLAGLKTAALQSAAEETALFGD